MDKKEILKSIRHKIDEINRKTSELRDKISTRTGKDVNNEIESLITELEDIRNKIQLKYEKLEKLESQDKQGLSEIEKNIYNSIKSYDDAFKKAGGLFKTNVKSS
jgi:uncharacterized coiled-coil DUF342 family protein